MATARPATVAASAAAMPGAMEFTFTSPVAAMRLALEMAAHEDSERRALEGELALLEQAWKEAEEVAGGFFVAGGDGAMLLEPVDGPLHHVALPVGLPVEAHPARRFGRAPRDDRPDAAPAQVGAHRAAGVALVADHPSRSDTRSPAAWSPANTSSASAPPPLPRTLGWTRRLWTKTSRW